MHVLSVSLFLYFSFPLLQRVHDDDEEEEIENEEEEGYSFESQECSAEDRLTSLKLAFQLGREALNFSGINSESKSRVYDVRIICK